MGQGSGQCRLAELQADGSRIDEVDYVRVYVRRLREKLGDDPEHPRYIQTERRLGYRSLAPERGSADPQD